MVDGSVWLWQPRCRLTAKGEQPLSHAGSWPRTQSLKPFPEGNCDGCSQTLAGSPCDFVGRHEEAGAARYTSALWYYNGYQLP